MQNNNNHANPVLIDQLHQSPLLSDLSTEAIQSFLPHLRMEHWEKRTVVMTSAQTAERFYILLNGRVRVEAQHPSNGRAVTLTLLAPGDSHNIVTLLDSSPHNIQAESLDVVETVSAPLERWQAWMETHPELRRAVFRAAARQMRDLASLAEDLALHDTATRLAHLLLRHFDAQIKGGTNLIHDLTHEDLAHLIGSVRVVVNRIINQFKREGIVHTNAGKLHVTDLERLLRKTEALKRHNDENHKPN